MQTKHLPYLNNAKVLFPLNQYSIMLSKNKVANKPLQNILMFLLIFITARGSWILGEDWFILSIFLFTFYHFYSKKIKYDRIFILIIVAWILINLISYLYNRTEFDYVPFIGNILKISTAYFILKLIGPTIFYKLEKVIFILTVVSLPFFVLELLIPRFFTSLAPYLNLITGKEQKLADGWYSIIFMHNGFDAAMFRNSGFMWEPGAFALMIIFGTLVHLFLTDFKPSKRRLVFYLIALITTFSTMGFVVLLGIFATIIVKKKKPVYFLLVLPLLIIIVVNVENLEFLAPKIEQHIELADENTTRYTPDDYKLVNFNRLGFITVAFFDSLEWPLGNGVLTSRGIYSLFGANISGGSSLGKILMMWGWLGVVFWFWSTYKFFKSIALYRYQFLIYFLSAVTLILAFASNPMAKSPLLSIIILAPYVFNSYNKTKVKHVQK